MFPAVFFVEELWCFFPPRGLIMLPSSGRKHLGFMAVPPSEFVLVNSYILVSIGFYRWLSKLSNQWSANLMWVWWGWYVSIQQRIGTLCKHVRRKFRRTVNRKIYQAAKVKRSSNEHGGHIIKNEIEISYVFICDVQTQLNPIVWYGLIWLNHVTSHTLISSLQSPVMTE